MLSVKHEEGDFAIRLPFAGNKRALHSIFHRLRYSTIPDASNPILWSLGLYPVYRCVRKDTEWELQYISPGCRQIIGYSANNLIAKRSLHFDLFIYHEDKAHVLSEITQAVRRNRKYRIEYRVIAHNGKIKWVSEYGRGEMNEENELVKLEGFVTDITKVKNYDFKLQHELKINQSLAEMGVELLGETIDVDSIACKVQENVMQYKHSLLETNH